MRCTKCSADLDPTEKFCGECGQPVIDSAVPPASAGQPAERTCPNCNTHVGPNKRFCSTCGFDLTRAAQPQASVNHPAAAGTSSSSSRIALIIGAGALLALFLLGGFGIGLWMWFGGRVEKNRPSASIAGTWNCVFMSPDETERGNMNLIQNGRTITGTLLAQRGQPDQITGTFDGQKFAFNIPNTEFQWQLVVSQDGSTMKGEQQFEGQTGTLLCTR